MVHSLVRAMEMTTNMRVIFSQFVDILQKIENSHVVTILPFLTEYGGKKYAIFIDLCMKGDHFACLKGK